MTIEPNRFCNELKVYLEHFRHSGDLPNAPVTITGIPREGLTVKYQHPSKGSVDPAEMAGEAARLVGVIGVGGVGGAAVGALIGKVMLGQIVTRVGVASAGAAVGISVIGPFALVGGSVATAVYAAYKIGKGKRDHERARDLSDRLIEQMQGFSPSNGWPGIEMYRSVPDSGLAALWQPTIEGENRCTEASE